MEHVADIFPNAAAAYLSNRQQSVYINGVSSNSHGLQYGVPQGSVLGPLLFTIYTSPLGDIIRENNIEFHMFADDTQLYLCFKTADIRSSISRMEICVSAISKWMTKNLLS